MQNADPPPYGQRVLRSALSRLLAVLVATLSVVGCSSESRHQVFALVFEESPGNAAPAAPVIRSPRHPLPPTPTPTPAAEADHPGAAVALTTWDDVVRLLPKDHVGNPDWSAALDEKVIAPRAGVAPDAPESEVLTLDVELVAKSDPAFTVVFSHQKHGAWLTCANCHTNMFEMKAGATKMAPADLHRDHYCAACHGKVAFDMASGCQLCHLRNLPKDANDRIDWTRALAAKLIAPGLGPRGPSIDQPALDLDVELTPPAQPALKGVFSHATHTKWLACANCHPRLFPQQANGAGLEGADLHARRYCGACHGSVAFGLIGTCGRCHPALEKARQHQEVFDLDVEVTPKSQPTTRTIFSHKTHRWVECPSCHTNLYEVAAQAATTSPADLYNGKYCATCHGKVTSDLITQCQRCHAPGDGHMTAAP